MLGLPAAYLAGGYLVAGGFTVLFACLSALACAFIAHACRIYREQARGCAAAPRARAQCARALLWCRR
jgi:hypothetical protein